MGGGRTRDLIFNSGSEEAAVGHEVLLLRVVDIVEIEMRLILERGREIRRRCLKGLVKLHL